MTAQQSIGLRRETGPTPDFSQAVATEIDSLPRAEFIPAAAAQRKRACPMSCDTCAKAGLRRFADLLDRIDLTDARQQRIHG